MMITTLDFSAISLPDLQAMAPAATRSFDAADVSSTWRRCPAACRWPAMGRPMIPSPMKPISVIFSSLLFDTRRPCAARTIRDLRRWCLRLVFAADPATITDLVEITKQEGIVDFAGAGLVAAGVIGQLDVCDAVEMLLYSRGEVALHDLHVIDVILDEEIFRCHFGNDLGGLFRSGKEESGNVAGVDRLDQQLDMLLCKGVRSVAEVFDKHPTKFRWIGASGRDSGKAVYLAAIQCLRVVDGAFDAVAEFVDTIGKYCDAAFARAPIACGQVVQHLGQPVLLQLLAKHTFFKVVGKQVLHTRDPRSLGRCEAVKERQFVEKHGQVGCELRHGGFSFSCCSVMIATMLRPARACCEMSFPGWSACRPAEDQAPPRIRRCCRSRCPSRCW